MEAWYDLHIHSALSPCADNDMTPGNIANMAALKGLDAIAVCDHNTTANVRACARAAGDAGICLVPGIEITTAEEVHVLVYFADVKSAEAFGGVIYDALPNVPNNESFFGSQLLIGQDDEPCGKVEKLLLSALPFDIGECFSLVREYGGAAVPAHVNKGADSLLSNLGFFPEDIDIRTIEVWRNAPLAEDISAYRAIYNSDAHTLWQIAEKENALAVRECTAAGVVEVLGAAKREGIL